MRTSAAQQIDTERLFHSVFLISTALILEVSDSQVIPNPTSEYHNQYRLQSCLPYYQGSHSENLRKRANNLFGNRKINCRWRTVCGNLWTWRMKSWTRFSKTNPNIKHSRGTCQTALKSAAKDIFTSEKCQTCGGQKQRDLAVEPYDHLDKMNGTFRNNRSTVTLNSLEVYRRIYTTEEEITVILNEPKHPTICG